MVTRSRLQKAGIVRKIIKYDELANVLRRAGKISSSKTITFKKLSKEGLVVLEKEE